MLFVHGVGLDHHMWGPCVDHLPPGATVHLPDLLGHGAAPRIDGEVTLRELSDDLAARLTAPTDVVGFSLGALVAQRMALDHPALVRSLVLVSSVARRTRTERRAVERRLRDAAAQPQAAADASVRRWTGGEPDRLAAEDVAYLHARLAGNDRASFLAAYGVFARADAELWPRLERIVAPTLVVTGADDPGSTPAMTQALADAIPRARAHIVPGARHLLPLEQPELLAGLILDHSRSASGDDDAHVPALHLR